MKCYECPYHLGNHYPAIGTQVAKVAFDSSLILFRPREGIKASDGTNPRDGEDLYLTGAPLALTWTDDQGAAHEIIVPAGFVTDLTSVPALFRPLVSRAGPWLEAAVVHDYLYVAWASVAGRGARSLDRLFADRVMLAAMQASGVRWLRRSIIFAGVRIAGARTYVTPSAFRFGDATDPRLVHLAAVPDLVEEAARTT